MKKLVFLALLTSSFASLAQDAAKGGVDFFEGSFKAALAKAKKENKLVMFDAYTTWCGPCKVLKTKVFPKSSLNLAGTINLAFSSIV